MEIMKQRSLALQVIYEIENNNPSLDETFHTVLYKKVIED